MFPRDLTVPNTHSENACSAVAQGLMGLPVGFGAVDISGFEAE